MKKHTAIVNKVNKLEEKYGIKYAKDGGALVKTLFVLSMIVWAYILFMNIVFFCGVGMQLHIGLADFSYISNAFITTIVCTVTLIIGACLYFCNIKIIGCAVELLSLPLMIFSFAFLMEDIDGFLGYNAAFYWRHAVPILIFALFVLWLIIVLIRAELKFRKTYNRVVDNIYKLYSTVDGEEFTEEQWDEILSNYDANLFNK